MKNLIFIVLVFLFCSCSNTKDLTKTNTDIKTDTETKTVSERTITTTSIEPVTLNADSIEDEIKMIDLERGDSISIKENGLELIVKLDPKTGKIKAKAKQDKKIIEVPVNKTIIEKINEDKKEKTETEISIKDLHKKVTGGLNLNYLWWLLLLIVIPIWKYGKSYF